MEAADQPEAHIQKVTSSLVGYLVTASICSGMQCMQVNYEIAKSDFGGVTEANVKDVV